MSTDTPWPSRPPYSQFGFTLIEMMIVVGMVAILAAVALPSYKDYVIRGKLVSGTNALAGLSAQMEQYYQDNRTYEDVNATIVSPCSATTSADTFTITCDNLTATTYTIKATGSRTTAGAIYTVNQRNAMATTGLPSSWGAVPSANGCWILRKGESC